MEASIHGGVDILLVRPFFGRTFLKHENNLRPPIII
jgi:hypothetical protein